MRRESDSSDVVIGQEKGTMRRKDFLEKEERGNWSPLQASQGARIMWLGCLLFLLVFLVSPAKSLSATDPLLEHLEFLGYECNRVEAGIQAKHFSKIHLYLTYAFGGIRVQTGFPGKPPRADEGSRYKVTNALGKQLSVMQLYWSEEGNLFAMAWMPGMYEKARFAVFMETWDHDTALLRQAYENLTPFLKEQGNVLPKG